MYYSTIVIYSQDRLLLAAAAQFSSAVSLLVVVVGCCCCQAPDKTGLYYFHAEAENGTLLLPTLNSTIELNN